MKKLLALPFIIGLVMLTSGGAEAWYPHHGGPDRGPRFGLDLNVVVPVAPGAYYYPAPAYVQPPVYVAPPPTCYTQTTPGHYQRVPWYTEPGGITVFRDEWVPPITTQMCR
jgi:hypothetical protein